MTMSFHDNKSYVRIYIRNLPAIRNAAYDVWSPPYTFETKEMVGCPLDQVKVLLETGWKLLLVIRRQLDPINQPIIQPPPQTFSLQKTNSCESGNMKDPTLYLRPRPHLEIQNMKYQIHRPQLPNIKYDLIIFYIW